MEAEIQALVLGFDFAFIINDPIEDNFGMDCRIEEFIYSKTIFNVVLKDDGTTERILKIDLLDLTNGFDIGTLLLCLGSWDREPSGTSQ